MREEKRRGEKGRRVEEGETKIREGKLYKSESVLGGRAEGGNEVFLIYIFPAQEPDISASVFFAFPSSSSFFFFSYPLSSFHFPPSFLLTFTFYLIL